MAGIYSITVQSTISAAHILKGYEGDCSKLHGHNWKIIAEIEATKLNDIGMAIDFKILKKEINKISKELDHKYINEIPPFDQINPTAENLAAWYYKKLSEKIRTGLYERDENNCNSGNDDANSESEDNSFGDKENIKHIKLSSITIYETENSSAKYYEE